MNMIGAIILFAVLGDFLLHMTADLLNLKRLSRYLPEQFQDLYDARRYAASQEYLRINTRFKWAVSVVDILLFLGVWFGKGFPLIDVWVRSVSSQPVVIGLLYIGILFLLKWIVSLPFDIYSTFVIEERFGFNQTTWKIFVSDMVKKALLGIAMGGVLIGLVLSFFEYAGPDAWWICWVGIAVFMLIMQLVVPTWVMPLFNKFKPLAPGKLKDAIVAYAESIHFSLQNIFVMDGSKRSRKSNAFFTGFGRYKRIVLYDTLINNHSINELVTVLAHEMGHYIKKHVFWMLAAGIVQTGIMLYLLSFFISSPMLFETFYMETPSVYAGLVFFGLLYAPVDFFMGIMMQFFSRRNEFAADRFATETTSDPASFALALKKLAVHNLSNLTPHPLYVFLNYSHPPVLERIEAISGASLR
ncbi:MAG: M48 family peptidase [Desulfobacteraceae bacterium]|nr:MAG: M48 family peptidase [Desulfobacteraceae bacterium]